MLQNIEICSNHENCEARRAPINMTKGFVAKEPMKWHMASSFFQKKIESLSYICRHIRKEIYYVNELRVAGQNGELSGATFIMYNQAKQQVKGGNKRESIQLGAPIFGPIKEDATDHCPKSNIEPIPDILQGVIDHLVMWRWISENRKPNSCIINFFDEGEFSQPFLKPPHIDKPISTLLLSESEMAFGRTLVGRLCARTPCTPSTLESLLVLVMKQCRCSKACYVLAPVRPMVLGPKRMSRGGTGVFLPWHANGTRKHTKHPPPRAQKGRFLSLPPPVETHKTEVTSDAEMIYKH
uniref:Uncharacterized protein n=1 Tax=Daucus carota subsp. sativus TaxID=79200 RepID=A0A166JC39_DAUCS